MPYCKYCGKQITEGESCGCSASKAAEEAKEAAATVEKEVDNVQNTVENTAEKAADNVQSTIENAAEKTADKAKDTAAELKEKAGDVADKVGDSLKQGATKVDNLAGEISEKLPGGLKNNKGAAYAALGVILILIICLLCLIFGGGVKSTVKKYVNSATDKKGGKTFYSLSFPDTVIDALKDEDKYEDMIDAFNESVEDRLDDLEDEETAPKFDKIIRQTKLSKSELADCEEYFADMCDDYDADDDVSVTKGYEVKVRIKYRNEDGKKKHETEKICVVKLKGDGWKIIPKSIEYLG